MRYFFTFILCIRSFKTKKRVYLRFGDGDGPAGKHRSRVCIIRRSYEIIVDQLSGSLIDNLDPERVFSISSLDLSIDGREHEPISALLVDGAGTL